MAGRSRAVPINGVVGVAFAVRRAFCLPEKFFTSYGGLFCIVQVNCHVNCGRRGVVSRVQGCNIRRACRKRRAFGLVVENKVKFVRSVCRSVDDSQRAKVADLDCNLAAARRGVAIGLVFLYGLNQGVRRRVDKRRCNVGAACNCGSVFLANLVGVVNVSVSAKDFGLDDRHALCGKVGFCGRSKNGFSYGAAVVVVLVPSQKLAIFRIGLGLFYAFVAKVYAVVSVQIGAKIDSCNAEPVVANSRVNNRRFGRVAGARVVSGLVVGNVVNLNRTVGDVL